MVPVHDYEKRYAEAFAITKVRTFKHEPFFIVGGGGGELIRGTLRYMLSYKPAWPDSGSVCTGN